jgi:putative serine protease PepD
VLQRGRTVGERVFLELTTSERRATGRPGRHGAFAVFAAVMAVALLSSCGSTTSATSATACNATSVADKVLPTVVTITVGSGSNASTGSGEVIRANGYILTNSHVVSPAANGGSIMVLFSNGLSRTATLTGRDPPTDLAVLKVDEESLPVIALGSSGSVQVGQPVVALGAPLGLSNTVTTGIVSALGRTIDVPSDNGRSATLISAVQTDAAINPGNSGGALTDCNGDLIGVPTANATVTTASGQVSAGNVGVNFAIPVDLAKAVADEIIATGKVTHSFFGIGVTQIPPAAAKESHTPEGLQVVSVVPGGPSANAGIQVGDVITHIDGEPAVSSNQLALLTVKKKPGDTVTLTYVRGGKSAEAAVTLGTPPG